jgi:hypothetical protein
MDRVDRDGVNRVDVCYVARRRIPVALERKVKAKKVSSVIKICV